jgi:CheY-like chemotaxis protein
MPKRILIVDDTELDAFMIKRAVQVCCSRLFRDPVQIEAVSSADKAIASIKNQRPDLLITDLFMPEERVADFSSLPLPQQCKEMAYPAGMKLLSSVADAQIRRIATTFFWNYPGFSRYVSMFESDQNIDGALPKDIFYLVGSLTSTDTREADFAPLRILLQALWILMKPRLNEKTSLQPSVDRWHMRSLFEESSAWLSSFPHNVLDVRADMQQKRSDAAKESDDISEYAIVGPWMPAFEVEVSLPKERVLSDIYKDVIGEIEKNKYRVHLRTAAKLALQDKDEWSEVDDSFEFDGKTVASKFTARAARPTEIQNFLTPNHPGDDDKFFAELLVTLGFFSYWCHLPDHRASRTAEEIATILETATGHSYRALGAAKALSAIRDDVELLNDKISRRIHNQWKREWWKHFHEQGAVMVIGSKRKTENQYYYWLNASIVLIDRHSHQ